MEVKIRRPPIRYPGGKFRIAKSIIAYFPPYKFYVEPYFGAGGVFFNKPKSGAEIINDISDSVINVFQVLRDPDSAARLKELCELTPLSYTEWVRSYDPCTEPIEWARRMIYRSFASIATDGINRKASGFRMLKNLESALTTAHEWANYPQHIASFTKRLQGVVIDCRPAISVIQRTDSIDTLFYLDPPYLMATRSRKGRKFYEKEMGSNDEEEEQLHIELSDVLHGIQGKAIVSGYNHPLYDELYSGWQKVQFAARAQKNAKRIECIWLSPNIQPTLF